MTTAAPTTLRCAATDGAIHEVPIRAKVLDFGDDRDAWVEARRGFIGSSDIWSIVSGSKLYDTWCSKVHPDLCEPFPELSGRFGHWNEPGIAQWHAEKTGDLVVDPGDHVILVHPEIPYLAATVDRFAFHKGMWTDLELKTAGSWAKHEDERNVGYSGWEERAPYAHAMQVLEQMEVTGLELGQLHGIILTFPAEWKLWPIEPNERFRDLMFERCQTFWERHVLRDIPPPVHADDKSADRVLNLLGRPVPGRTYVLPSSMRRLGEAWDRNVRRLKRAERIVDTIKHRVKRAAIVREEDGSPVRGEDGKIERAEVLRIEEVGPINGWTWKPTRSGSSQFRRKKPSEGARA